MASRSRRTATRIVVPVLLMALDRVYLGYHWPTDVLASACLALLELGMVVAVDSWRTVETETHVAPATAEGGETRPVPVRRARDA